MFSQFDQNLGNEQDVESPNQPGIFRRCVVAIADSFGWLNMCDQSIVSNFRGQHPVFPNSNQAEVSPE